MANEIRAFSTFMDFALGIDSVSGEVRGQGVTRTPASSVPNADGQTVMFQVQSVTSISDVQKAMGISADAQASFLGGGGSTSFNFSESTHLHSFSSFLLVSSFVTNASTHMLNEQALPAAQALISAGQLDRFAQEFGDLYIKGIETGGQLFALIEVETTDSTDQAEVAASLSAEAFMGAGVGGLTAHFSSNSLKCLSTHKLTISSLQIGGAKGSATQAVTANDMLNAASNFATTVFQNPVPFRVELQDYQSLNLPPPPNAADIQNAKDVLADCVTRRAAWLQFRNDIQFILQHPEQFQKPVNDLSALDNQGAINLNQISAAASSCLNNLKACQFVSSPAPDRSKLPGRNPAIPVVTVPNFAGLDSVALGQANIAALQGGAAPDLVLTFMELVNGLPIPTGPMPTFDFKIRTQNPAAGTVVARHSGVTLSQ